MANSSPALSQQQALAETINAIHTAAFARCLAKLVKTYVSSDCCLVLSYQASGAAVYLYDDLTDKRELLFSQYLNGLYAQDPFYRALRHGLTDGVYSLNNVLKKTGGSEPEYAAGFYQATGWQQEVGIVITLDSGQGLTLFLGRLTNVPFSTVEQTALRQLLPVLSALCRQHWPKGTAILAQAPVAFINRPSSTAMLTLIEQALATLGQSRLTTREQQVAALLVQGQDNAAIAKLLGIGEGTVKNHRKHLYAKLALDRQGALFAHFLNHLITYDDSAPSTHCSAPSSTSNL